MGKCILISEDLLPANNDIIFLSFFIKLDKSVFALLDNEPHKYHSHQRD